MCEASDMGSLQKAEASCVKLDVGTLERLKLDATSLMWEAWKRLKLDVQYSAQGLQLVQLAHA
jgi:hypothetical protein